MRHLAALAFLLVAACLPETTVKTGPGTSYPCGVNGKLCAADACCGEDFDCGGYAGCEPGMCCYVGPENSGAWGKRARIVKPQWAPAR
jgi:hypothetical protein